MMTDAFTDHDFRAYVRDFLATWKTASLATLGPGHEPYNANVQFVADDALDLYFVSSPQSQHSLNLAATPAVALTIYAHVESIEAIHGLQIRGTCATVDGSAEWNRVYERYTARYTFAASYPMRERIESERFYRVQPHWIRIIDNRRHFGWRTDQTFTPDAST